jgi:signal peptidase II
MAVSVSVLLSGAVGNLIDRVRQGFVVDFIDWYVTFDEAWDLKLFTIEAGEKHWPTWNVADACITVGVALLLIEMLFVKQAPKAPPDGAGAAASRDKPAEG